MIEDANLDEYDETEWFSIMHLLRPEVSREEFHDMWLQFQVEKYQQQLT